MRRTWGFIVLLFVSIYLCAQEKYIVTGKSLNVRNRPSLKAKTIGSLKTNQEVLVYSIDDGWALINFKNRQAYISAKFLVEAIKTKIILLDIAPLNSDIFVPDSQKSNLHIGAGMTSKSHKVKYKEQSRNNFGIDLLPSAYLGISNFDGDYVPMPMCGLGVDIGVQFYPKQIRNFNWLLLEASLGYSMKGGGGMYLHYMNVEVSPIGYRYIFKKQNVSIYALAGLFIDYGGGKLFAQHYTVLSKFFYSRPWDMGIQVKLATDWRNFGLAISYNRGFVEVIDNANLALYNTGLNFHFVYRLMNLMETDNRIYKP